MDERLLKSIANDYLVPFFSGARLEVAIPSSARDKKVAFFDPVSLAFKVQREDSYRLILTRSQPFAKTDGSVVVPEIQVVNAFVDVVGPMAQQLSTDLKDDLLSTFQRRVVARSLASTTRRVRTLLDGIDQLVRWSTRLYEGAPVSAAIGFRYKPQESSAPTLLQLGEQDFSAVVSNGHDTLLEFDFSGRLISHGSLPSPEGAPPPYSPFRQAPIADWTTRDDRRVAMCLSRVGDILVFRDKQLLFALRSGRWHFLTHDPVIKQMRTPHDMSIRTAIYETCLDASFARTGACLGVVSNSQGWSDLVDSNDQLEDNGSEKAKLLNSMIRGSTFQELDRRLRQELVAIDGATVIAGDGRILAVGAILKIAGGSTGGGRLAAAKALGEKGLGIKVSQDGGITGFRPKRREPAFRVM